MHNWLVFLEFLVAMRLSVRFVFFFFSSLFSLNFVIFYTLFVTVCNISRVMTVKRSTQTISVYVNRTWNWQWQLLLCAGRARTLWISNIEYRILPSWLRTFVMVNDLCWYAWLKCCGYFHKHEITNKLNAFFVNRRLSNKLPIFAQVYTKNKKNI